MHTVRKKIEPPIDEFDDFLIKLMEYRHDEIPPPSVEEMIDLIVI